MRHTLPILAALLGATTGLSAQTASAEGYGRRLAHRPLAEALPPDVPYRDPRPRLRLPQAAPPVAAYAVQGYQPRPTYQPMYNEPPRPLR